MGSWNDRILELDALMPFIRERLEAGQSVRFSPHGRSMRPMLRQGRDAVELSPAPPVLKKYDLPLYRRADGQYVIHRVIRVSRGYSCVGDNQCFPEYPVTHDQILAVVTAFSRDGKWYSVHSTAYRLYCRIWCALRPVRRVLLALSARLRRLGKKKS